MIDHIDLRVSDLARTRSFYETALAPLGYALQVQGPALGFGTDALAPDFWVRAGEPSTPCPHFAFRCARRDLVDAAYREALLAGGVDRGAPRLMPQIHAHYYAGFVGDPDGHPIEFACHAEQA